MDTDNPKHFIYFPHPVLNNQMLRIVLDDAMEKESMIYKKLIQMGWTPPQEMKDATAS